MIIAACCLRLHLPLCASLKAKRSLVRPLLARLHREFNIAAAEVGLHDVWQSADLAIVAVSNDAAHVQSQLETVVAWIERNRPEVEIVEARFEMR